MDCNDFVSHFTSLAHLHTRIVFHHVAPGATETATFSQQYRDQLQFHINRMVRYCFCNDISFADYYLPLRDSYKWFARDRRNRSRLIWKREYPWSDSYRDKLLAHPGIVSRCNFSVATPAHAEEHMRKRMEIAFDVTSSVSSVITAAAKIAQGDPKKLIEEYNRRLKNGKT